MCERNKVKIEIYDSQGSPVSSLIETLPTKEAQEKCLYYGNGMCNTANSMSKCDLNPQGCRNTMPIISRML